MGIDAHGSRFLLYARSLGVDFARTLTIGRQGLHLRPAELRSNLARFGLPATRARAESILSRDGGYAGELLRLLGAEQVHSLDASDYEGATHLHDLNRQPPDPLAAAYTVVLDGGSLEHVFNFPRALKSCMEMVAVGGHFLAITPANNFMGHGFYQFSPELFLSVFVEANGYRLEQLIAFEDRPGAPWYRIHRPASPSKRIMSRHSRPVYLLVLARRTEAVEPLASWPQQTDYVATWEADGRPASGGPVEPPGRGALARGLLRLTPEPVKQLAKKVLGYNRRRRRFDPRYFRRIDWREELGAGSQLADGD